MEEIIGLIIIILKMILIKTIKLSDIFVFASVILTYGIWKKEKISKIKTILKLYYLE